MRPRTVGEILSAAFEIYKANASNLILIVAVVVVPLSLLGTLLVRASGTILAASIAALIAVIIFAVLQAAILRAATLATIGDPVDVEASYRWGFKRFGSVLLVAILVGLAVFVGLFLLLVGAIIFGVFFSVSIPALVIENRRGTEAMTRSWQLVSGHFWHALGVIIVAWIIAAVLSSLLEAIGGDNWFATWIFSAIAQIITAPFTALVSVLLYLDLRSRKEALTAASLRAELASGS
jgi:hypothetical protein